MEIQGTVVSMPLEPSHDLALHPVFLNTSQGSCYLCWSCTGSSYVSVGNRGGSMLKVLTPCLGVLLFLQWWTLETGWHTMVSRAGRRSANMVIEQKSQLLGLSLAPDSPFNPVSHSFLAL